MGSPNFYTNTNGLNVAVDSSFFNMDEYKQDYPELDEDELEAVAEESQRHAIQEMREAMQEFIDHELPELYFHTIELDNGYHDGFQAYIDTIFENREQYIASTVSDWKEYGEITDRYGNTMDLDFCPYLRSNFKNMTPFNLKCAIDAEYKELHNLLLDKAKELGLGEVVGRTWTSSVNYPINTKPI